jgi:hypothetical protein
LRQDLERVSVFFFFTSKEKQMWKTGAFMLWRRKSDRISVHYLLYYPRQ